jgi:hypothetical protein
MGCQGRTAATKGVDVITSQIPGLTPASGSLSGTMASADSLPGCPVRVSPGKNALVATRFAPLPPRRRPVSAAPRLRSWFRVVVV